MDLFTLLPDEKILEICQQMNVSTLNRMIRTNKRIYQVCQEVIDKRLIQDLVGRWVKCYDPSITSVIIEEKENNIAIFQERLLLPEQLLEGEMKGFPSGYYSGRKRKLDPIYYTEISKDDTERLKYLWKKLIDYGFKNINDNEIWAHVFKEGYWIVHNYYNDQSQLGNPIRPMLLGIIKRLNLQITSDESDEILKNIIIEELKSRGQIIYCDPPAIS